MAGVSGGDQSEEDDEGREGSPVAEDEPPPFAGRPTVGGEPLPMKKAAMDAAIAKNRRARLAQDAARRAPPTAAYAKRFPNAARIKQAW
jgi:hypothetical protein